MPSIIRKVPAGSCGDDSDDYEDDFILIPEVPSCFDPNKPLSESVIEMKEMERKQEVPDAEDTEEGSVSDNDDDDDSEAAGDEKKQNAVNMADGKYYSSAWLKLNIFCIPIPCQRLSSEACYEPMRYAYIVCFSLQLKSIK